MAMVVKLEAVFFVGERRFSEVMGNYTLLLHRAVAEGTLTAEHHREWPLLAGLKHVLAMRQKGIDWMEARAHLEAAGGVARASVDVVISVCSEPLDWLRLFRRLPWRQEDRSADMRSFVALRLYHKCPPATAAEQEAERLRLEAQWSRHFSEVQVRFVHDAARADDCSAYLAYIVDRYDDLPQHVAFLHADSVEHVPGIDLLADSVFAAARGFLPESFGFAHLAHNHISQACRPDVVCQGETWDMFEFPRFWKGLFASSLAPSLAKGEVEAYCCGQLFVRRERILLRPRSFYRRALAYFAETLESHWRFFPAPRYVWAQDIRERTPCQFAMYAWHAMFGEPLRLPRRQLDPNIPLFMKLSNVEMGALQTDMHPEEARQVAEVMEEEESRSGSSVASRIKSLYA